MVTWLIALAVAAVLTLVQYAGRLRPLTLVAGACRFLAVLLVAALALDAPSGRTRRVLPIVALDASLSSTRAAAGDARWNAMRDRSMQAAADSVLLFGDSVRAVSRTQAGTVTPQDLASRVRPAVERALAAGRPLVLVTDGELDDADALRELPAGSEVRVVAAGARPDLAVRDLEMPHAIVSGDTVDVQVTVVSALAHAASAQVALLAGPRELARVPLGALTAGGEARVALRTRLDLPEGAAVIRAVVHASDDAEPRNDTAAVAVDVARAAGAVWVSTSPDYDARYALAVLRGAVSIPARGYLRVAPGMWRAEGSLAPVTEGEVRAALRDAPIAILHGDTAAFGAPRSLVRGPLALVVPAVSDDEWYASGAPASPLAPALAGVPWDSLPPINTTGVAPRGEWTGLEARRSRSGEPRAIVTGAERDGQRTVVVVGSGMWRWKFRGGVAADAYTSLWGSIFDWLAQARGDRRAARPDDRLVRAGEPITWRRGSGRDSVVRAVLVNGNRSDTLVLRFAAGATTTQSMPLAAGVYQVGVPGGAALLVVNASRELLPREPTVKSGTVGSAPLADDAPRLRSHGWIYLLAVLLLCADWVLRRRIGLR